MTPKVILQLLGKIQIGDILLETTDGRKLALCRVAQPKPEQARILAALNLNIPERLSPIGKSSEDQHRSHADSPQKTNYSPCQLSKIG
jgi:hypothetical protein